MVASIVYSASVPCSLTVEVPEHSHILQLIVRDMLIGTLDISAAASDVMSAEGPMGVKLMAEAG